MPLREEHLDSGIENHVIREGDYREQPNRHQDPRKDVFVRDAVTTALVSLLEHAHEALCRDAEEASRCIAKAKALLHAECDLRKEAPPGPGSLPLSRWQLSRVLAFLDANLARAIRREELAAVARLSVSYFSHAFRRTVGEPPLAHLRRRRIERAQQLMLLTEKSLAEIAGECGLADQSHLTKLFRQIVGMTPGAWRRWRRA
jgi:AraC family transcriptional regulator